MKALELLKEIRNIETNFDHLKCHKFDETIEELEKLENRKCDGCKHYENDDAYPTICWECSRYYDDRYEPKGKQ